MEAASNSVRVLLSVLVEEPDIAESLLKFSRQLEEDYHDSQDINLFIYAIRCFFCLERAEELRSNPEKVDLIRSTWLVENDAKYTGWLSSAEDAHDSLKWAKWTFQAKNSILSEFIEQPPYSD
jgi:hypothetical protein